MMYPLVQNPERFVWDFWYHYDTKEQLFNLFYLNADPSLVPSNQHHFSARVGYGITKDFSEIDWIDNDVFQARDDGWDNTSIWTGDIIETKNGFVMFYTSRDKKVHDGFTQNIGMAYSEDFVNWKRVEDFRLHPDPKFYETQSLEETTIHAWRDPYIFRYMDSIYMLVCAKSRNSPLEKKGAIAILQATDESLMSWYGLPPLFAPSEYSECEVPQFYKHGDDLVLVYSCQAKYDYSPITKGEGGLYAVKGKGHMLQGNGFKAAPEVILPESSGFYACRVIPELNGDIVGFSLEKGGLQRVESSMQYEPVNRNFSDVTIDL